VYRSVVMCHLKQLYKWDRDKITQILSSDSKEECNDLVVIISLDFNDSFNQKEYQIFVQSNIEMILIFFVR